jgi:hypothetical protein
MRIAPIVFLAFFVLAGCSSIPIDVGTSEAVKVDIAMKVDVYQHADPQAGKKVVVQPPPTDVAKSRRDRMAEIQILKNSRLVGESHAGSLAVRNLPPGEYGDYVRTTVDAENADRARLLEKLAKEKGLPVADAEKQQAELFRKNAFPGEWIEVPDAEGKFAWKQKE